MSSSKSGWERFFKEAGIPGKLVAEYANIFCDNRMRLDMLEELNKEVLQELGIKAVGDIIAILRFSKIKQKELSRTRSQSPDVEVITKKPNAKAVTTKPATAGPKMPPNKSSSLSMTVKASDSASSSSKSSKVNRKSLSQRFNEYEKEAKQKKIEEQPPEEKQTSSKANVKKNTTVFTIQLPSKPPPTKTNQPLLNNKNQLSANKPQMEQTARPQKVTLVPAQGKTLNRNKKSTSIFDRLDRLTKGSENSAVATTSTSKQKNDTIKKTVKVDPKQDVFSRLGNLPDEEPEESPPKNVFSRLGGI